MAKEQKVQINIPPTETGILKNFKADLEKTVAKTFDRLNGKVEIPPPPAPRRAKRPAPAPKKQNPFPMVEPMTLALERLWVIPVLFIESLAHGIGAGVKAGVDNMHSRLARYERVVERLRRKNDL